jgi:hypothetical protein
MKRPCKAIALAAGLGLALLVLFPPFFGVDRESNGRIHAALGHHPIWRPPSSAEVFRALSPGAASLPEAERLAAFQTRFNAVDFAAKALLLLVLSSVATLILRPRKTG